MSHHKEGASSTATELEQLMRENLRLQAEVLRPASSGGEYRTPYASASSKTRVELDQLQAENERLRAERAVPPPPSASSKTRMELERMQAENERLRAAVSPPPPPSASSKTRAELDRMQAENERLRAAVSPPPPPSASSKTRAELDRMHAENESLRAAVSPPPPPSASSKTRAELDRMHAENERLRAERAVPPPTASSKTRAELERLKEENERLQGKRDSAAVELEVRKIKDARMKENYKLQAKIEQVFREATSVDVVFIVDCTSSMQTSIEMVKGQVIGMATDWQSRLNNSTRAAFVGYRDYADKLDWHDFTSDMHEFKDWVGKQRATGGGDTAEDVFSGLEQATKLSWKKGDGAKLVFIIADAPCHGTNFHDGVSDDYPAGDKHRRSVVTLLRKLQELGVQTCNFSHLNNHTKKMVREFKRLIGDDGKDTESWLTEDELNAGDTAQLRERLFHRVSETLSRSITASFSTYDPHRAATKGKVMLDTTPNSSIDWKCVPTYEGHRIKQLLPNSMNHLLEGINDGEELLTNVDRGTYKICSKPFDDGGATRLPFHAFNIGGPGKTSERYYVAKVFRSPEKEANRLTKYKQQAEIQAVAAFMAIQFNKAKKSVLINNVPDIKYIMATTLCVATKEGSKESNFNIERWLQGGDIIKFNSNYGYVNHTAYADLVQAFSHWTWHASKKKLMVVDAQGVWDKGRKQYTLFDPCVHCVDTSRFQASTFTNMGERGFDKFFLSHKCNDFCKRLGLPKHRMQFQAAPAGGKDAASHLSV